MAKKRGDRSRNKNADLRYILIKPKLSGRIKLPDRLFHPERTGPTRIIRAKVSPLESHLPNLSLPNRIMATLIAAICVCAGLAMIVLGVRNGKWLLVLLGPFGVGYGIAWVRIAHDGRLPGGRMRLNPWGRR
ncbi:hypothetical protein [Candidatus Deferrimicrobium sp.]|jgi:hypothetical protein|uniref:hypothetical protein n=1 Tax=Candidatus Deferrimicrobium sp. TaxID=3060586 RepID=UPI002ED7ABD0